MNTIHTITTDEAPAAVGPYVQAKTFGEFIFASGQIALAPANSPQGRDIAAADVAAQTEQVIANIRAVLRAAGSNLEHVIKATCFLTDMAHFQAFNEVYAKHFASGATPPPARSCVAVKELPKKALVEIEVIAVKA